MTVAQSLDRRITIRRKGVEIGRDEWNLPIVGPDIEFTVWASREDVSDGERMAAGSVGGYRMTRFIVRYSKQTAGILPSDELLHEGRNHNILGIKETKDGRRRFLEITTSMDTDRIADG